MRNKTKIKFAVVAALLAAAGFGYFYWMKMKAQQAAMQAMANAGIDVTVITVSKNEVDLTQDLPARVTSFKISEIRPQVEGIVQKIRFEEGSFVKAGQTLYDINADVYKAAYDEAKANLAATQAKKNRYQKLLKLEGISKQEYDDILSSLAKAKSDFKKAKQNLDYSRVAAPISGYIGKSNVTEGAIVSPSQTDILVTITQLDPIYVDMVQPSSDSLRIGDQKNAKVSVIVDENELEEKGILKFSEVFADEGTDSVRLRAKFSNKNKKLIPGMFINARLHLKPIKAITVPQKAATRTPNGTLMVFVVMPDNIAKARMIKAEQTVNDQWVVSEGLEEGETIVYEGILKLADGAKVKPTPLVAKQEAEPTEASVIKQ